MSTMQPIRRSYRIQQYRQELARRFAGLERQNAPLLRGQIWRDYLDCLEAVLLGGDASRFGLAQEMLLELACMVRDGGVITHEEYPQLLDRLIALYARGVGGQQCDALTHTAADYADLIEAASVAYPAYDYSTAVGQLLSYMGQLYHTRRGSWKMVYDHIASMPESVEAVRYLHGAFFSEVRQWTEEGAANLFAIRRDHLQLIETLTQALGELGVSVATLRQRLPAAIGGQRVVQIGDLRQQRTLKELMQRQQTLQQELEGKRGLLRLIEQNIDEFEEKLRVMHRNYSLRLVYSC